MARRLGVSLAALEASHVQILSAGLSVRSGAAMTSEAQHALQQLGISTLPHTAQPLTVDMAQRAEAIFCMTQTQCQAVIEMFPAVAAKTHCLDAHGDIADPTGGGLEAFLQVARRMQSLIHWRLDEAGLYPHPVGMS
jgi:protein-tyrosine-phosphatase